MQDKERRARGMRGPRRSGVNVEEETLERAHKRRGWGRGAATDKKVEEN